MPPLHNIRRERFCHEYLKDTDGQRAYVTAGFTARTTQQGSTAASAASSLLLQRQEIIDRMQELRVAERKKLDVSKERWLQALVSIAFTDTRRFQDAKGNAIPLHQLEEEVAAALQVEQQESYVYVGTGKTRRRVVSRSMKLKSADKTQALMILGKYLGFVVERHEHTGAEGGPIEITAIQGIKQSLTDRLARLATEGAGQLVHREADLPRGPGSSA